MNGEVVCATQGSKHADIAELQSTPTEVMGAPFTVMGDSVTITNEYQDSDSSRSATVGNSVKIDLLDGYEAGYNFPEPDDELRYHTSLFITLQVLHYYWCKK